jgi:hypothetical protein
MLCTTLLLCKFSSQSPSDMSNPFVKHVQGTRFDSIRRETCMILCGNLPLLLPIVRGTRPAVSSTRPNVAGTWLNVTCTRPVVACTQPLVVAIDPEFT